MVNGNKEWIKNLALIAGGGLSEAIIENYADKYAPKQDIIPGTDPYNMGDALGAAASIALTVIGILAKKPSITYFGAGGLAVAVPNIVGKALTNNSITLPGLRAQASMPVMQVMPPSQIPQIAPTITSDTGGMLLVGSSGGGKQVYKPSAGEESNAGLTQIMLG